MGIAISGRTFDVFETVPAPLGNPAFGREVQSVIDALSSTARWLESYRPSNLPLLDLAPGGPATALIGISTALKTALTATPLFGSFREEAHSVFQVILVEWLFRFGLDQICDGTSNRRCDLFSEFEILMTQLGTEEYQNSFTKWAKNAAYYVLHLKALASLIKNHP